MPVDERDLGLLGLLGVEALLLVREQELDEPLGRVGVLGAVEDARAGDADERARVVARQVLVRDRRVRPSSSLTR